MHVSFSAARTWSAGIKVINVFEAQVTATVSFGISATSSINGSGTFNTCDGHVGIGGSSNYNGNLYVQGSLSSKLSLGRINLWRVSLTATASAPFSGSASVQIDKNGRVSRSATWPTFSQGTIDIHADWRYGRRLNGIKDFLAP